MKKVLSIIIAALMMASALAPSFAASDQSLPAQEPTLSEADPALFAPSFAAPGLDYADLPDGWSREAVLAAISNGLLQGYDGKIDPQGSLTRAQMAAILVRAFGATKEADASVMSRFTDIDPSAWYYRELSIAVNIGLFNGDDTGALRPNDSITREEVAVVLARAFYVLDVDMDMSGFIDAGEMSDWARDSIAALAKSGKMNGYEDGMLRPKSPITREEFAQIMHKIVALYITEPGEYTFEVSGAVIVRSPGVVLKDCVIEGELVLGHDIALEDIVIDNTQVSERLIVHSAAQIIEGDTPLGPAIDAGVPGDAGSPADSGDADADSDTDAGDSGADEPTTPPPGGDATVPLPPSAPVPPSSPETPAISTYALSVDLSSAPQTAVTAMAYGLPGLSSDGVDALFYRILRDHMRGNEAYIKSQILTHDGSAGLFGPLFNILKNDGVVISDVANLARLMEYVAVAPGSAVSPDEIRNPYLLLGDMVGTTTLIFSDAPLYNEARIDVGRDAGGFTLQIALTVSIDRMRIISSGHSGAQRVYGSVFDAVEAELGARYESYGLDGHVAAGDYVGEIEAWFAALTQAELDSWLSVIDGDSALINNKDVAFEEVNGFSFVLHYSDAAITVSVSLS
jgi:hypothetical protein